MKDKTEAPAQGLKLDKKTLLTMTAVLVGIIVFAGALTQLVPRGEYQTDATGNIIPDSYTRLPGAKLPIWKIIASPVLIFTEGAATTGVAIILFIVLIGGTFLILDKSGVLKYILTAVVSKFKVRKYILLSLVVFIFMALAAVIGIMEESLTLVPLAVAISLALGWDSLVGIAMSLVAVAFGYSAALFNPFNVVLVQEMAGLPIFSGLWYRLIVFALVYLMFIAFLIPYAKKIEKHPEKSFVYESDKAVRAKYAGGADMALLENKNLRKAAMTFVGCVLGVLVAVAVSFALQSSGRVPESLAGMIGYLPTIAMALLFTIGGLLAGRITGLRGRRLLAAFGQGVKAIAPAIPLLLLVICVTFVLGEGKIIHTILHWVYEAMKGLAPAASLLALFLFVMALEFFIASGSAKAFLIMPIVLPLAQMVGLSGQNVVLAFMLSDGLCNIAYPTSSLMILAIGMVGISYGRYMRWFWKLFLAEIALSVAMMLVAVAIGYS